MTRMIEAVECSNCAECGDSTPLVYDEYKGEPVCAICRRDEDDTEFLASCDPPHTHSARFSRIAGGCQ